MMWVNGREIDLVPATSDHWSFAGGLNDDGTVVGGLTYPDGHSVAWTWVEGRLGFLALPPSGVAGSASAINNRGVIVGSWTAATSGLRPVLWHDREPLDLSFPGQPPSLWPNGVNDSDQIIAGSSNGAGVSSAWTWIDGTWYELSDLVTDPVWTVVFARDINTNGWIAAMVKNARTGKFTAAVLRPVP